MEALIGQKLPPYTCEEETVLVLQERVGEAQRMAAREMRETEFNRCDRGSRLCQESLVMCHTQEDLCPAK